jgi:hypothetical protein
MAFLRLGFLTLPLALILPRLLGGDAPASAPRPTPAPRPRLMNVAASRADAARTSEDPANAPLAVLMPAPAAAATTEQNEPVPPARPVLAARTVLGRMPSRAVPAYLAKREPTDPAAQPGTANYSRFRRAVLDTHPYTPAARAEPLEESIPILLTRTRADPDVLLMPKFEVFADEVDRGLHEAILNYRDPRPINNTRFGTGLRQKDFGKVRAGVVTILYIPIMFGLSW